MYHTIKPHQNQYDGVGYINRFTCLVAQCPDFQGIVRNPVSDYPGPLVSVSFLTSVMDSQDANSAYYFYSYDFVVPNQTGTYWYHSHYSTQYCDGLRYVASLPHLPFSAF